MSSSSSVLFALCLVAAPCAAQSKQFEVHGNYQRGNQTHQKAWGGGAQVGLTIGPKLPLATNTSLGVDYLKTENSDTKNWSVSYDAVVQPGGSMMVTPYAGGSVGANWTSTNGTTNGAALGLNYILGATLALEKGGGPLIKAEVRPGYVRHQEHTVTYRVGVVLSM